MTKTRKPVQLGFWAGQTRLLSTVVSREIIELS